MARNVRLVIVCEDLLHATFLRAFLYKRGFTAQQLTFKQAESGQGDAKQEVCKLVCRELQVIRKFTGKGLVYVIDADNLTVAERRRAVEQFCRDSDVDPPRPDEAVFGVIPKWEIENWLAYLRGEPVDEDSNRYEKYRRCESDIYPLVERLADMCDRQDLPSAPASLEAACTDYPRFREWIGSS
jgi:hypothetical protein